MLRLSCLPRHYSKASQRGDAKFLSQARKLDLEGLAEGALHGVRAGSSARVVLAFRETLPQEANARL